MKLIKANLFLIVISGALSCSLLEKDPGKNRDSAPSTERIPVTFEAKASRTSGVAPLGVVFNAGFVSSTETERPFHDKQYVWDFGDPPAGTWAVTGRDKNRDEGPVAAHIYESPGTYTATVTIKDVSGTTATGSFTITVDDPGTVYSGTGTICISDTASADFTGCPPGAVNVTTDDITAIRGYIGSSKRILLQRGSSWSLGDDNTLLSIGSDVQGPVTIGAYGSCASPDSRGICGNAPEISLGNRSNFIGLNYTGDWRIQDLAINGSDTYNAVLSASTDLSAVLLLRVKSTGFYEPVATSLYNSNGLDQIMIVSCDISGANKNGIYMGSERIVIMGNRVSGITQEHAIRVWQGYFGVISHNEILNATKHGLKLHGIREDMISETDDTLPDHRTEYLVISGNIFGSTYAWSVAIAPQSDGYDERLYDILVEKNRFVAGYGTTSTLGGVQNHLVISASSVTVRNNIFDGTGSNVYNGSVIVSRRGIEPPPEDVFLYNNTIYKTDTAPSGTYYGMYIDPVAAGVEVKNNLVQPPSSVSSQLVYCYSDPGCTGVARDRNLITGTPGFTDPSNGDPLLRDFSLQSGSPAIDNGVSLPLMDDFTGTERPRNSIWDIGAFEY